MGLNPFRPHRRSYGDLAVMAGALIVTAALVAWALLG